MEVGCTACVHPKTDRSVCPAVSFTARTPHVSRDHSRNIESRGMDRSLEAAAAAVEKILIGKAYVTHFPANPAQPIVKHECVDYQSGGHGTQYVRQFRGGGTHIRETGFAQRT
jgi:hypothetical protein